MSGSRIMELIRRRQRNTHGRKSRRTNQPEGISSIDPDPVHLDDGGGNPDPPHPYRKLFQKHPGGPRNHRRSIFSIEPGPRLSHLALVHCPAGSPRRERWRHHYCDYCFPVDGRYFFCGSGEERCSPVCSCPVGKTVWQTEISPVINHFLFLYGRRGLFSKYLKKWFLWFRS